MHKSQMMDVLMLFLEIIFISMFRRSPETHAVSQSAEQRRPNPRLADRRGQPRQKRLPQGQGWGETRRDRGRPAPAPHRRHRRFRYPLHRVCKVPPTLHFPHLHQRGTVIILPLFDKSAPKMEVDRSLVSQSSLSVLSVFTAIFPTPYTPVIYSHLPSPC